MGKDSEITLTCQGYEISNSILEHNPSELERSSSRRIVQKPKADRHCDDVEKPNLDEICTKNVRNNLQSTSVVQGGHRVFRWAP